MDLPKDWALVICRYNDDSYAITIHDKYDMDVPEGEIAHIYTKIDVAFDDVILRAHALVEHHQLPHV